MGYPFPLFGSPFGQEIKEARGDRFLLFCLEVSQRLFIRYTEMHYRVIHVIGIKVEFEM